MTRWTALVLLAGLVLAAFVAPVGQARGARERSPEEEATVIAAKEAKQAEHEERKQAESEERAAARKAQRESERSAAGTQGTADAPSGSQQGSSRRVQNSTRPRTHGDVQFSCTGVTWNFTEFPETSNTIVTVVKLYSQDPPITIPERFSFTGPTAETTTLFHAPPGTYRVDAWAKWKGTSLRGSFDILGRLTCRPAPAFSIEKLQKIAGGTGSYTSSPITGEVGDTVDYEIIVTNTGNVPLTLSEFTDRHCGPVSGGPGSAALAVGASTTYSCTHVLEEPGSYANKAEVDGTPPQGDGRPVGNVSNTVVAEASPLPPAPAPAFSVEKLQQIAGTGSYTSSQLTGAVGQTVDYEIVVDNTGNVPLTLGSFTDPQCDPGTLSGGTEGATLPVGATTTYTCTHLLDAADESAGSYANTVSVTGTPPNGGGLPVTHSSNTVVVTLPSTPSGSGGNAPATGSTGAGSSGVLSSTFSEPAKSGVLAFASAALPTMKGPQGCVRQRFHISIKSAHVASVTFYMDGHRLRTLTAKNARKGLLTIEINPAKLKVGVHKLVAKITMTHTASTQAKRGSRTVRILRCSSSAVTPKFTG